MLIWLASYPRSGNTLLRTILFHAFGLKTHSIYNDPDDIGADSATANMVGHEVLPPDWSQEQARADKELWLVKTHDQPAGDDKAIYIIRDGRESLVSHLHYKKSFAGTDCDLWPLITGNTWPCSWCEHVRAWNPARRGNTLLLKFEDLAANPAASIPLIAGWLGRSPVSQTVPSFADLHAVNPAFFRSGRTDSWQKEFSENQHFLFWLLNHEVMLEFGYRNKIPALFENELSPVARGFISAARESVNEFARVKAGQEEELNGQLRHNEAKIKFLENAREEARLTIEQKEEEILVHKDSIAQHKASMATLVAEREKMERTLTWKLVHGMRKGRRYLSRRLFRKKA